MNALTFSSTNFFFSKPMDHGEKERKRHDLALERFQTARDKWSEDRIPDFIKKRLHEKNEARTYNSNVDKAVVEYY